MERKRNLVSLFAGCGGLDLGLEMAGFETVIANEIEPHACETLRKNKILCNLTEEEIELFIEESLKQNCFKRINQKDKDILFRRIKDKREANKYLQIAEIIEGDIRGISSKSIRDKIGNSNLFAIAGGPPCQPFSKAGKQKSLDCTKNGDLFYEFVRLVDDLTPRWFIFENVKGITFTKTDVIYSYCLSCNFKDLVPFKIRQDFKNESNTNFGCPNCGSKHVKIEVLNEPGGSLKIIINEFEKIGYKCFSKVLNAADFGAPQSRERLIIVGTKTLKKFTWPKETHQKIAVKSNQVNLFETQVEKKSWVSIYDAIWRNGHPVYGRVDKESAVLWVKNVVRPHDEPVVWNVDRYAPTIGAHQGAKLAYAPKGVPPEQIYRQQWHTRGRRQGDTKPVYVEHHYLSDEELLKLQTFPCWWYLHGTRMQRAFQIGNAVPPILGKVIGEAVIKADMQNE